MRKLRKVFRYWRARLQPPGALPFFWHVGRPNFGDDINPEFFRAVSGRPVRLTTRRDRPHFLAMGSILGHATSASTVLGSGFLSPPEPGRLNPGRVVAVRGELSRRGLAGSEAVLLGDPMVLLDRIVPIRAQRDGPVGLVPHVTEVAQARRMKIPGVRIIDPAWSPWRVVREIAGCSRLFSQSLHGLIAADALEIPNIWVSPGARMVGSTFKFEDYFTTLDAPRTPHPFEIATFAEARAGDFHVSHYKYNKSEYLAALAGACE